MRLRPRTSAGRADLIATAMALRGTPYRNGGTEPSRGFDCSGFVQWVFAQHGTILPRGTRGSTTKDGSSIVTTCRRGIWCSSRPSAAVPLMSGSRWALASSSTHRARAESCEWKAIRADTGRRDGWAPGAFRGPAKARRYAARIFAFRATARPFSAQNLRVTRSFSEKCVVTRGSSSGSTGQSWVTDSGCGLTTSM